jgi:hypothetical protein
MAEHSPSNPDFRQVSMRLPVFFLRFFVTDGFKGFCLTPPLAPLTVQITIFLCDNGLRSVSLKEKNKKRLPRVNLAEP